MSPCVYDEGHTRVQFIAAVAVIRKSMRYLEIGVQNSTQCFDRIGADRKWGVDPAGGGATHIMTSDAFFSSISRDEKFDLVFIDGDHNHAQVVKDIENALEHLDASGVLVMHDCIPINRDYENPSLSGTAWRAFANLRQRANVEAYVGNFDHGVGVARIRHNSSPIILPCGLDDLTYDDMIANCEAWLRPRPFFELLSFATSP